MTRILVCGTGDYTAVSDTLDQVNRVYGPISCVIHANHPQALAWQQKVALRQRTLHLPIVEDRKDGPLAGSRHRDRLFAAKPTLVVIFEPDGTTEDDRDKKVTFILHRAQSDGIHVVRVEPRVKERPKKKAVQGPAHAEKAAPSVRDLLPAPLPMQAQIKVMVGANRFHTGDFAALIEREDA